jgi:hypothetical protein
MRYDVSVIGLVASGLGSVAGITLFADTLNAMNGLRIKTG